MKRGCLLKNEGEIQRRNEWERERQKGDLNKSERKKRGKEGFINIIFDV